MKLRALLAVLIFGTSAIVTLPRLGNAAESVAIEDLGTTCLDDSWLKACVVLSAGYLNTTEGEARIAFQIQRGSTPGGGDGAGIVLLQPEAGRWAMLASDYQGAFYEPPLLSDGSLLHVPAYQYGTAGNNADLLFQWYDTDSTWHAIDLTAWQNDIGAKLPPGLSIWKGVTYDFKDPWLGLFARTSLWQESDADCCATGGNAVIEFTIVDDVLIAGKVNHSPPLKTEP
jgi:hypothetical protein